ncbi:putative nuclease HARBI1, partial [Monomorium pharaonis]|uniref:putative nuclease HARBI1 n=1 Tax=Monomorium pharaonis TaxID=307658 RepID=UPI0017462F80
MEVQFGIGKVSLHRYFLRVIHALYDISSEVIRWPDGHNINKIKNEFYGKAGMPDVIGAIDGSHIEIEAPKIDAASYRTSKKKYTVQLQAVCDASLVFTDCFAGYPGAVHDVCVLHNSPLYRDAMRNERALFPNGEYFIGDKGYQP